MGILGSEYSLQWNLSYQFLINLQKSLQILFHFIFEGMSMDWSENNCFFYIYILARQKQQI